MAEIKNEIKGILLTLSLHLYFKNLKSYTVSFLLVNIHYYYPDQLTPQHEGLVQGMVIRASVHQARLLSPARIIRKVGKGSTFKDGFSPEYMLLKASLHAHVVIRRLLWTNASWQRKTTTYWEMAEKPTPLL